MLNGASGTEWVDVLNNSSTISTKYYYYSYSYSLFTLFTLKIINIEVCNKHHLIYKSTPWGFSQNNHSSLTFREKNKMLEYGIKRGLEWITNEDKLFLLKEYIVSVTIFILSLLWSFYRQPLFLTSLVFLEGLKQNSKWSCHRL